MSRQSIFYSGIMSNTRSGIGSVDGGGVGGGPVRESDRLEDGELNTRLRLIEQQPLDERSAAFGALYEGLMRTLESGQAESFRPHG